MPKMTATKESPAIPVICIGIVSRDPVIMWDYDYAEKETFDSAMKTLHDYILGKTDTQKVKICHFSDENSPDEIGHSDGFARHWGIFETRHGLQMIVKCPNWDEAQTRLLELKLLTGKQSILSCRKQRIRISPKYENISKDKATFGIGGIVSPEPKLIMACLCWTDVRKQNVRYEIYKSYENIPSTKQTQENGVFVCPICNSESYSNTAFDIHITQELMQKRLVET